MKGHDTLLLFGATGDLSVRYLFPSLVHLLRDRLLPPGFQVVAIGRQDYDDEGFRLWLEAQLPGEAARNRDALNQLLARVSYRSVDLSDREAVARALSPFAASPCLSYLAIPPDLFIPTCEGLQAAGLLAPPSRPSTPAVSATRMSTEAIQRWCQTASISVLPKRSASRFSTGALPR